MKATDTNHAGIMPSERLANLRMILNQKGFVRVIEAHDGLTGLIVEKTSFEESDGSVREFDAMWVSSLCDSTAKGKPDIELVDFSSRQRTLEDILEVTTKPIILDGDSGGKIEHLVYNIRTLERLGISAIILEDKIGSKRNSLFGTDAQQQQDSIEHFSEKIAACKNAQITKEFMVIARIESLILNQGMEDALNRAKSFAAAGADGIMIHSCKKTPDEIIEFCHRFRESDPVTPLITVPSTYSVITESELQEAGANVAIYANHFIRSSYPAMVKTAKTILQYGRAYEADSLCMPIKEILTLIPDHI